MTFTRKFLHIYRLLFEGLQRGGVRFSKHGGHLPSVPSKSPPEPEVGRINSNSPHPQLSAALCRKSNQQSRQTFYKHEVKSIERIIREGL